MPYTDPGKNLAVNIFRAMNNAPAVAKGFSSLGSRLLGETSIDPHIRELVIDAISVKLDSPYEWSHHAKWALDVGATTDELEALKSLDFSKIDQPARAALEFAMLVEGNAVDDAAVDAVRAAGFDDQQIVELIMVASFYGMTARFINAVAVEYDEGNPQDFAIPSTDGSSRARRFVERDRS